MVSMGHPQASLHMSAQQKTSFFAWMVHRTVDLFYFKLHALLSSCFPNAEILWHGRGAAMPDRSWWKETKAFPDRATGVYRYVDQYTVASSDTPTDFATPTNAYTPSTLPTPTPTVT